MTSSRPARRLLLALPLAVLLASCNGGGPSTDPPTDGGPTSSSGPPSEEAISHLNLGVIQLERFDYGAARGHFDAALKLREDWVPALFDLALADLNDVLDPESPKRAAASARRVVELAGDEARSHYVLAYVLGEQLREFEGAMAAARRVTELAPDDAHGWYQLGRSARELAYEVEIDDEPRAAELVALAESSFRKALERDPRFSEANYKLARLLVDSDDTARQDEGEALLHRHQEIMKGKPAVQQNYLTRGPLARAWPFEPTRPEPVVPVALTWAEPVAAGQVAGATADDASAGLSAGDLDGDGKAELIASWTSADTPALTWHRVSDAGIGEGTALGRGSALSAPLGDFDGDGDLDLVAAGGLGLLYFENQGDASFAAGRSVDSRAAAAASVVDFDHEGDLDLVVSGPGRAWRNDGAASFTDVAGDVGLTPLTGPWLVWSDLDGDNAIDVLARQPTGWMVFHNDRSKTFQGKSFLALTGQGWLGGGSEPQLVDLDFDADLDLVVAEKDDVLVFVNASKPGEPSFQGPFTLDGWAAGEGSLRAVDLDRDGFAEASWLTGDPLDGPVGGVMALDASGWPVRRVSLAGRSAAAALPVDLDGDGALDLLGRDATHGAPTWWRGSKGAGCTVSFDMVGREERSNPQGLGAKLDVVSGSLRQYRERRASVGGGSHSVLPEPFAFGDRPRWDGISITWPSGIGQAELGDDTCEPKTVTELDRQPSSCPMVYGWGGERFDFLSDCFSTAPLGLWIGPGRHWAGDAQEHYRLRPGVVQPIDGVWNLAISEFLNESLLADRAALSAWEHDAGTELLVDEGVRLLVPPPALQAWEVRSGVPVRAARLDGRDVTAELAAEDREVTGWVTATRWLGLAEPFVLELDLAETAGLLRLAGSLNFSNSTNLFSASQAGVGPQPPRLSVLKGERWEELAVDAGVPAGFHKDLLIDLKALGLSGPQRLRLETNLQVSYDQAVFYEQARVLPAERRRVAPLIRAEKRWLGIPGEVQGPQNRWRSFPREGLVGASDWVEQDGERTGDGDVRTELATTDRDVLVLRPGEEVLLGFDVAALPAPDAGRVRTHVLDLHGWVKDFDPHTMHRESVGPLPTEGAVFYP
ncbi:MAG: FG-GAP-like repeat-containing protein [Acidobacteriota bacterium]